MNALAARPTLEHEKANSQHIKVNLISRMEVHVFRFIGWSIRTVFRRERGWIGLALALAALCASSVAAPALSAQTSTELQGQVAADPSCQLPSPEQIQAQIQQSNEQMTQDLAQALNLPEATVQAALQQVAQQLESQPIGLSPSGNPQPDPLASVATQLGVTKQALLDAMKAAAPAPTASASNCVFTASGQNTGAGGTVSGGIALRVQGAQISIDGTTSMTLFNAIAQQFGNGLTGAQVQAVFQNFPKLALDSGLQQQLQNLRQEELNALASALNVSVDTLNSALQSVRTSMGCSTPSPDAGLPSGEVFLSVASGPAQSGGGSAFYVGTGVTPASGGEGPVMIGFFGPVTSSASGTGGVTLHSAPVLPALIGPCDLVAPAPPSSNTSTP